MSALHRLRELRNEHGLTQAALAEAVGIARQSLIAIESGRAVPSVTIALALARVLGAPVEAIFGDDDRARSPTIDAELLAPASDGRVAVTVIDGQWIAAPLELGDGRGRPITADGVIAPGRRRGDRRARIEPLRDPSALQSGVLLVGCAPALGLVAEHLNARPGPGRFAWIGRGTVAALGDLAARRAQVVGVHFGNDDPRAPREIGKALPGRDLRVIGLVAWEAGMAIRRGDGPSQALAAIARPGARLALRERGAGIQRLFEAAWRKHQRTAPVPAATLVARGHLEAAHSVALGAVDAGLTIASAARRFDLDFVPLGRERFDLVVERRDADDPRIVRLLDALADGHLRRALVAWGDDVGPCGDERSPAICA